MRLPEFKRKRKWPSLEEFWNSNDPKPFRLIASDHADWRKFKRWMSKTL